MCECYDGYESDGLTCNDINASTPWVRLHVSVILALLVMAVSDVLILPNVKMRVPVTKTLFV